MTKSEALSKAMKILNSDGMLMPGDMAYDIVVETLSDEIDLLGPEKALEQVERTKAHLVENEC